MCRRPVVEPGAAGALCGLKRFPLVRAGRGGRFAQRRRRASWRRLDRRLRDGCGRARRRLVELESIDQLGQYAGLILQRAGRRGRFFDEPMA